MRETIAAVGGYWRPLAGLARLLEELGELAQDLANAAGADALQAEFADIWIISTALADQFLGDVAEPGVATGPPGETQSVLLELFAAAAPVARIVNYYDGPKTPRPGDELGSLNEAVARLHGALSRLAGTLDVDLARTVARKLDEIGARDQGRFAPAGHDPSSAAVLARFQGARGPHTRGARLWGAPDTSDGDSGARVRAMAHDLVAFTRAAGPEQIEGYVIEAPTRPSDPTATHWLLDLLASVAAQWPPGMLRGESSGEGHELSFMGLPLVIDSPAAPGPLPEACERLVVLRPVARQEA